MRRDTTNKIFIGGIPIDGPANNKLTNWLLNQKKVSIEQGEVDWRDEFRQAPVLTLKDLNLSYKTHFIIDLIGKHKFTTDGIITLNVTRNVFHQIEIIILIVIIILQKEIMIKKI